MVKKSRILFDLRRVKEKVESFGVLLVIICSPNVLSRLWWVTYVVYILSSGKLRCRGVCRLGTKGCLFVLVQSVRRVFGLFLRERLLSVTSSVSGQVPSGS